MIDRKNFFDAVRQRPFNGALSASNVSGVNSILDEWEKRELEDMRWLAYMLATTKHETANTMQPITEMGSQAYLRGKRYWPWIGRGYVQLTWQRNYQLFRDRVMQRFDLDLIKDPTVALKQPVAAFIMFEGMLHGQFTGKKLSDYFHGETSDWINARRIINGLDRAADIAAIGKAFFAALEKAAQPEEKIDVQPGPKPAVA